MQKVSEDLRREHENGVIRICVCPHPFHQQLHSNILCSLTQLINIIVLDFLRYLVPHTIPKPIKTWLIDYFAVVRQCRQKTGSGSYHCCSREACRTSRNLIDAGKPALLASPCSDVPVPLILCHLLPFAC